MEIRRLQRDGGPVLKQVWLRALADTPTAFGARLADEAAKPDTHWSDLAQQVADADDQVVFFAYIDGHPYGMVHGIIDANRHDLVHVGAMWVDPAMRRRGLAHALLNAIIDWAQQHRARQIELWVTEDNAAAIRFYRSVGFQDTGRRAPLPSDSTLQIRQMTRNLMP